MCTTDGSRGLETREKYVSNPATHQDQRCKTLESRQTFLRTIVNDPYYVSNVNLRNDLTFQDCQRPHILSFRPFSQFHPNLYVQFPYTPP